MNHDSLAAWETRIVLAGLRILTITTFLAFLAWAFIHLWEMFK